MDKNQVFNNLLHLSGLVYDLPLVVNVMQRAGYTVTINHIRDWRRSINARNYRPVPNFALEVLFNYLFELKKLNKSEFPNIDNKENVC